MALRGTATQSNTVKATAVTVNVAGIGIQVGDYVVLEAQAGGGTTNTVTFPTGFNAVPSLPNQGITGDSTQAIAAKFATAADTAYTITNSANDYLTVTCHVFSGRNPTAPITAVAVTPTNYSGTSPVNYSVTGLTAAANDDVLVWIANKFYDGTDAPTFAPASGFGSAVTAYGAVQYSPLSTSCVAQNVSAGAVSITGASLTVGGGSTALGYGAFVLSIAAASGATSLAIVQSADNEGANPPNTPVFTIATQFPAKTTAGNGILAIHTVATYNAPHTTVPYPTDTQGNTWNIIQKIVNGGAYSTPPVSTNISQQIEMYLATNIAGDSSVGDIVTFHTPNGDDDYQAVILLEIAGIQAVVGANQNNMLGASNAGIASGAQLSTNPVTVGAGQFPALAIAIFFNQSGNQSAPGVSWTPQVANMTPYKNLWAFQGAFNGAVIATAQINSAVSFNGLATAAGGVNNWYMNQLIVLQGAQVVQSYSYPIRRPRRIISTVHYPR